MTSYLRPLFYATALLCAGGITANASTDQMTILSGDYAVWDIFPTYKYTDLAPGSSLHGGPGSYLITQTFDPPASTSIPVLLDGGDVTYSSSAAYSWTINAIAGSDISGFQLQIRHMNETSVLPTLHHAGNSYTMSTSTRESAGTYIAVEFGNMPFSITMETWTWTGLDIQEGDSFSLTFVSGSHTGFDAIGVHVIPEPSTYALIGAGLAGAALLRRRRQAA